MTDSHRTRSRDLFERLARIAAADDWDGDVNPTQMTALSYLSRANRFSRAPSQVADYMAATRGTVSQTLKALARKELIVERRSQADKRSISYEITDKGREVLNRATALDKALETMGDADVAALDRGLSGLAGRLLAVRGMRPFGICHTCRHFSPRKDGGACRLLAVDLSTGETRQICHEQEYAA